jgi:putative drug exporter of the RND superfamily
MLTRKLAEWSVTYAGRIILLWVFLLSAALPAAMHLPDVLNDHGLRIEGSSSERAEQRMAEELHLPREPIILLFQKEPLVSSEQFTQYIDHSLSAVKTVTGVGDLMAPSMSAGMRTDQAAYALVHPHVAGHQLDSLISDLRSKLPQERGITVELTGKPVIQADVNEASRTDLSRAELIGLPLALLILWRAFGGLTAALIPIAAGLISVIGAMGIMYAIGTEMPLSVFVLNVLSMVGLALSIDFALILVSRFREEHQGQGTMQALSSTLRTSGKAIVFSAICVLLGLGGVCFFRMPIFTSVALGAMVVLSLSTLVTLTLVPALLALLADKGRLSYSAQQLPMQRAGFWYGVSSLAMKRPLLTCILCAGLLLACLAPAGQLRLAVPDAQSLPPGTESRQAAEAWERLFGRPGTSSVDLFVGPLPPQQVTKLLGELAQDPLVVWADVRSRVLPSGASLISVRLQGDEDSPAVMDWLREQEKLHPQWEIGGEAKYRQEVLDQLVAHVDEAAVFMIVSNMIILLFAFRSLLLPLKMIVMNMLSLGAAFGILAWLFQSGRLGLEETNIAVMIPVFIFGLAFGISMDYGVFLVSRMAESYRRTGDNERAVQEGLAMTGKLITSAAAIMIAVTLPFASAGVSGVKQLGIGIACAVFIDATVIRMLLVPAFMKLMGKWNWWFPGGKGGISPR